MACNHEQIKCVNCVKFCAVCGVKLTDDILPVQKETTQEGPKKAAKRTTKKGAGK